MGGLLSQPITSKDMDHGEGLGLRYGLSSMQGWRPEMEDAHDVRLGLDFGLKDWSFFAVFDGHAGRRAAAYAAWNLLDYILRDGKFQLETGTWSGPVEVGAHGELSNSSPDDPIGPRRKGGKVTTSNEPPPPTSHQTENQIAPPASETTNTTSAVQQQETKSKFSSYSVEEQLEIVRDAIKSGFLNIDQGMRVAAKDMSGCTAVCALISPTHFFIANCGDSRAVLFDGSTPRFVTEDHKPYNAVERKRIMDAGGTATQRINGTLAVSRALGDFDYKKDQMRGPCEQLVSPEPEVTIISRIPADEFLILACDGIWDVMNNEDLCLFVRHQLMIEPDLEKICSSVLDVCLRKGSRDNMSIIIVVFETGPKLSENEIALDKKNDELLLEIADSVRQNNNTDSFPELIACLEAELEQHPGIVLPPGAGLEAKYDLLHERFDKKLE